MNLKFWEKKPAVQKRLVGLSQRPTISKDLSKILPKTEPKPEKVAEERDRVKPSSPMQPYLAIIRDDIKRLLNIDEKGRKDKETYQDFMEQYFGK